MIRAGNWVEIQALRYDHTVYRWRKAMLLEVANNHLVTYSPQGHIVHEPDNDWISKVQVQSYFWTDRMYNVVEGYSEDGKPLWLYANIASPITIQPEGKLSYLDYELDVYYPVDGPLEILDEDEFLEAIEKFGYDQAFIDQCYSSLEEAKTNLLNWEYRGLIKRPTDEEYE